MELKKYLTQMTNLLVTNSTSGGAVGSNLLVELENNWTVFLFCTWRMEYNKKVICSSLDSIEPKVGLLTKSVRLLEGKKIQSIQLLNNFDLEIFFEDSWKLSVFADNTYSDSDMCENWIISFPEKDLSFFLSNNFEIKTSNYYS